ncbi:DegT/DnrJ/EryC1/StrS family aminotransferase [Paenibacillus solisilvae]|uniref:DegT/DnrJ/EryC1/StrS family aminotransferase n=1 Tax=Paenibacillus solisilvae TaxID=2486751 RepID=A0ABW0VTH9_9BACL
MKRVLHDDVTPVRTKPFPSWPVYGDLEKQLLMEVVESGKWGGTSRIKLEQFEEKFAAFQNASYAISVNNGTIAITAALLAAGVKAGDEVIMPPYTFIATATAALMFGALPVFVDIEADTLLLDPEKVEAAITPRTKAIIAVHIAGAPADLTRLKEIASKHDLQLLEDAAQAVGAQWEGVGVGAIGDIGTFSFQSSKNLNSGEGGIILTNDKELADRAWSMANVGRVRDGAWYQHEEIGWNLRLTEFQAAILLAQMSRLESQCQLREQNAAILTDLIGEIDGIQLLKRDPRITRHAYHLYMFRIASDLAGRIDKADVIKRLQAEGIPVAAGYVSLNQNKAIIAKTKEWSGEDRLYSCPVSERMCDKEALWLTQNVLLGDEQDMVDVATALRKVIRFYS